MISTILEAFVFASAIVLFSFTTLNCMVNHGDQESKTFKRCVEVGVEVSKCNEIAGFKKEKQND